MRGFNTGTLRKARKEYKCDSCGGKIEKGEEYLYFQHTGMMGPYQRKYHYDCVHPDRKETTQVSKTKTTGSFKGLYGRVSFFKADNPWKAAERFYGAARRRDWWVTKDGSSVHITDVAEDEVRQLLDGLNLDGELS